MAGYVPWNSQDLDVWAGRYARGEFIDLDGLSTHYLKRGSGKPVILIHGFFFDTNMWNPNIDRLAEHFTVYALDLWGFGYSTRSMQDFGYPLYAHQVRLFMDALELPKAALVGQSMGAGTIMEFALSNRERVDRMVLVNAAGLPNPLPLTGRISNLPLVGEFLYSLRGNSMRRFILCTNFVHNAELITDQFFNELVGFHKVRNSTEVMLRVTRGLFFDTLTDTINALGQCRIPTLISWGRNEKAIALPIGQALHRVLPGSDMLILDQAGHCSNIDQASRFNSAVIEFLA